MQNDLSVKRGFVTALAALVFLAAAPGALAQEVLYGSTASSNGGEFGTVNQSTGEFTLVGDPTASGPMPAIAMNSLGEVYCSNNSGSGGSSSHGILIRVDPANGQLLGTVGDITDSGDGQTIRVSSFEFQPGSDVLFGVASNSGKAGFIYTIDTSTAAATLVGDSGLDRGGLAFAPDGTLYLATARNSSVFARIDPTDGSVIGTPLALQTEIAGLAVRPSDGVIFANYADGSELFTIDPSDGSQTLVGSYMSSSHVADLTFLPSPIETTTVESFLVPERILLRQNSRNPARSSLRIAARLDECCAAIDYTQAVTLEINGMTWNLPGLTPNRSGTLFRHTDDELRLKLRPRLRGTSRGIVSVSLRRDLSSLVLPDGDVTIRLAAGTLDVSATATLVGTRFIKSRSGDFVGPAMYPVRASLRGSDPTSMSVRVTFGLNGIGGAPGDVHVGVGGLEQILPADEFTGSEDRPRWRSRDAGVRSLRIDYRRKTVTLSLAKANVGFTGGDLTLQLRIAGETVAMTITPRARGSSFSY